MRSLTLRAAWVTATWLALCGPGVSQCQLDELTAGDAAEGDFFGISVSIQHGRAVVGAVEAKVGPDEVGAAYVFERRPAGWIQAAKLLASDGAHRDAFGTAVSISGDLVLIGASKRDEIGQSSGTAYLFARGPGGWTQDAKLVPSDAASGDNFGNAVAIGGGRALVGARSKSTAGGGFAGAAYVFELQGGSWVEVQRLVASDGSTSELFGTSLSIAGDRIVVGAPRATNAIQTTGAVYVFELQAGTWVETDKLSPTDPDFGDSFGVSVAQSGDRLIVGQQAGDGGNFTGSAYVLERSGAAWSQVAHLISSDQTFFDLFGVSVALAGGTALVGAPQHPGFETFDGAVYVFVDTGSGWIETRKLVTEEADVLGHSVAIDDGVAIVGAIGGEVTVTDSGSAYLFSMPDFTLPYCFCDGAGPCGNHDPLGGCASSTGAGARLFACGSPSIAADDLELHASGLVPSNMALLFVGDDAVNGGAGSPFGDGLRCASGNVVRLQVVVADGSGSASSTVPIAAAGGASPGDLDRYQWWYRDPTGSPCGSGFNLSHGLEVTWAP